MARRPTYNWPSSIPARLNFERGARQHYPTLRGRPVRASGRGGFVYTVTVEVPFYVTRQVTIHLTKRGKTPYVTADGPTASPHRYDDNTLCMWQPRDPETHIWTFADGLLDLLDTIKGHLFREAWWRETGEWLGPECPHIPTRQEDVA